jgi:endogenous inhibitor of DNA gyrase (YacG/DUF329 family)
MKDCPDCGSQNKVDASECYFCGYYFDDENEYTSDFNNQEKQKYENKKTLFKCPVCNNNFKIYTNDIFNAFACINCRSIFSYEWENNKLIISAVRKEKYIPEEIRKAAEIFELKFPISQENLKSSYHKKMAQYHPDKVSHLAKEFIELSEQKTKEIIRNYELLQSWVGKQ